MKRLMTAGLVLLLAGAVAYAQSDDQQFGESFTINEITPLSDIIDSPDKFVGKEIRTAGYVYEMCTASGCWLGILPTVDGEKMVKISWMETDVRFPIGEETTGHYIEIQGEIITAEQEAVEHEEHMADEEGEHEHAEEAGASETRTIYTCPMHPDVVQDEEGRCPICRMNLVKKEIPLPTYADIAIKGNGAVVKVKK